MALLLFVGIPLPGTGAWTGTLAASLLDMDFKSSVVAVMCGVLLAGIIMGAASAGLFGIDWLETYKEAFEICWGRIRRMTAGQTCILCRRGLI